MSIAHELSSEVATAMLARQDDGTARSARDLARVVSEVHTTLRQMTAESRRRRNRLRVAAAAPHEAAASAGSAE